MLTRIDRLLLVRGVPIFQELRLDFLVRLASIMNEIAVPAGKTIFTEGQEGRSLYIVIAGKVRVHIGNKDLVILEKGSCFGEMSLFDAEPRSASVTAITNCSCLVLTQQQLYEAINETPDIAVNIICFLSGRIRSQTKAIAHYLGWEMGMADVNDINPNSELQAPNSRSSLTGRNDAN
ncbi:cyclic nucleotide-binding domain-containing protein [Tumidithrix elongata RA019]|uniref:Cyclic nucleotide-binding domain-containing protein n=1 Tax=Tumidithrix elongata BACA0141 TaxID=2716417 RepID=A0AAW9PYJ1_9CYAN|nr:cyclic nucleotide-binding domain-containing protein [Tumidithrix elongata RA019]